LSGKGAEKQDRTRAGDRKKAAAFFSSFHWRKSAALKKPVTSLFYIKDLRSYEIGYFKGAVFQFDDGHGQELD